MSQQLASSTRRKFLSTLASPAMQAETTLQDTTSEIPERFMRSPNNPEAIAGHGRAFVIPPLAVIALNRMGFGPRPGDVAAFNALGATDDARLDAYVEQQLVPDTIDDSACEARFSGLTTHQKTARELWDEHWRIDNVDFSVRTIPGREAIAMKWNRAIHSKRQLKEALTDFWHDHFSIYWEETPTWTMLMHYDRDVIRPNILGNFRTMLGAVTKSPTMMWYLDQVFSSDDGPNENFARELLELHTLGSENYYGALASSEVPGYPNPAGYVEDDVFEVTKALTGWSIRYQWWDASIGDTGEFIARDDWHNVDAKVVLGQPLAANQSALDDGEQVLDILAEHPGTATFVARKLCRRFISDFPPQSIVDSTAQVFLDNVTAPDQLTKVMRHLLKSAEFRSTWGEKTKRPFHAAVSALRSADCDYTFQPIEWPGDDFSNAFNWYYGETGHAPFEWHPPNGYPDFGAVWQSSSSFVMRLRMLNYLVDESDATRENWLLNVIDATPKDDLSPNALVDFWIDRIFGYELNPATRDYFVDFMAQGRNPSYQLAMIVPPPNEDEDWNGHQPWARLRALVGLMFMSPEFQLR